MVRVGHKFASGKAWMLFLLTFISGRTHAAGLTLTVDVPKTAYLQWITNTSDPITNIDGDLPDAFSPYTGGAMSQLTNPATQAVYLGVMSNSLAGYEINFVGANSPTTTSAQMTQAGAGNITYTCALTQVPASFSAGTTASTSLDLTGGTMSASTSHVAESDLPMNNASPNVWDIGFSLPAITSIADGLIMSGTYTGAVTATITMK